MSTAKHQSDEAIIRKLDEDWGNAASAKKLDAVVAFYAADGSLVWPGAPAAHGTAQIRDHWKELFKTTPGLNLRFTPERIDISADGTMASDFGKVEFGHDSNPYVHITEIAKYVVVWKKVKGSWKVLFDCYNMNAGDA